MIRFIASHEAWLMGYLNAIIVGGGNPLGRLAHQQLPEPIVQWAWTCRQQYPRRRPLCIILRGERQGSEDAGKPALNQRRREYGRFAPDHERHTSRLPSPRFIDWPSRSIQPRPPSPHQARGGDKTFGPVRLHRRCPAWLNALSRRR